MVVVVVTSGPAAIHPQHLHAHTSSPSSHPITPMLLPLHSIRLPRPLPSSPPFSAHPAHHSICFLQPATFAPLQPRPPHQRTPMFLPLQPYTSNIYVRRVLSGEFTVVNQHLLHDLNRLGLWCPDIKNELVSKLLVDVGVGWPQCLWVMVCQSLLAEDE